MCWEIRSTSTEVCALRAPVSLQQTAASWLPQTSLLTQFTLIVHQADASLTPAGYVHLFQKDAQLQLVRRITSLEQRHAELLMALPEDVRAKFRTRHASASEVPGGSILSAKQIIAPELSYVLESKPETL